ncbi:hypothetical protein Drose_34930 [Dactylosporangium roseum]|uniref:DUF4365 domain-containing protein n=1 Tax=Dactylosporangium roseum TaxID=47989 RepID=A0ABY5Z5B1_9ACTN|nr:hypothetical protein [Dactylosporangium roseum]UWZ36195.1 hypothetical protein Drose_34930 [Dactylosporangium roseum]
MYDDDDDDAGKSADAGRMGKAAEHLVAAFCVLATRGALNVSTSMVDDEGVDLIFHRRNSTATLAVQVKARMSDSKRVRSEGFVAFVRSQTFTPRSGLDMLFVAIDITRGAVMKAWLIPSTDYARTLGQPSSRGRYRFGASMKGETNDRWRPYRLEADELPAAVLRRLDELSPPGAAPTSDTSGSGA